MPVTKVVCPACGGRAVYHGYQEAPGVAVPCTRCKGNGCVDAEPFTGIVLRTDIQFVQVGDQQVPYDTYIAQVKARQKTEE